MRTSLRSVILAISLSFALAPSISAAPGDLDPAFSGDGKLLDWLSRGDDSARGVAVQPDGKIVVAGTSWTVMGSDFAVARYNPDGSLDTLFGIGGKVTTDFNSSYDGANTIAIQQDGKIVAAGVSDSDFALVRYNSDGSPDTSFGANGKVTTNFNPSSYGAYSVAIHTDGKIVAAGGNAIARYNTDGSLDTTFDSDGKVTAVFPSRSISLYSVAIQADGKIVAAGQSYSQRAEFALVRYSVDGPLDTSFDGDGLVTTQVGQGGSGANSVAIQSDGKIVAAGSVFGGFGLVRYSPNGAPDNVTVQMSNGAVRSVAIQPDGKIVAAGESYNGSNRGFAVVRLNANFSIDTTFGTNGRVTTLIGSYASASGVAVQTGGKIVAAGYSIDIANSSDFAVVRYNANGLLDTSFDGDGQVTTDYGFFYGNVLQDAVVQPDGEIIAAGGVRGDFAVLRYNPDGSPDTAFGSGTGKVLTDMGRDDGATAVAIQTDGKVVVAGGTSDFDGNACCFALARYNVDGSLDTTFGVGGKVITGSYGPSGGASDVVIQPDGKIVAAGYSNEFNYPNGGFAVYRYNSNGSLDTSFDGDGRVITPIGSYTAFASDVAIQSDGKIVAAGSSWDGFPNPFIVVRYNGDGSLDPTFDGDGIVITSTSQHDEVYSSVLQPDGKIIVAGSRLIIPNDYESTGFALLRYNPNGSLDTTFGAGGVVTTPVGLQSGARAVALQPNGKIVASGSSSGVGNSGDFAIVRYNANGSLDSTFGGGDGIATADFDISSDYAYGMALDNVGRAVLVGGSDDRFAIARFLLTPAACSNPNPIDCPDFFVRQQYRDFLGREADDVGLANWLTTLTGCANGGFGEFENPQCDRVHVSASFFQSDEFLARGYWLLRVGYVGLNRSITDSKSGRTQRSSLFYTNEFIPGLQQIGGLNSAQQEETAKAAYIDAFVQLSDFQQLFPNSDSNSVYVTKLESNAGVTLPNKQQLIDALNAETKTRAQVLRDVVESQVVFDKYIIPSFVDMEYKGYLRRDPDPVGYNNWIDTLTVDPANYRHMVFGFIYSTEYRSRFGAP